MSILNQAYANDKGRCFGPIYFPTEVYSLYINTPLSDASFDNFRLDLVDWHDNVVATDIAPLERVMLDAYNYNIYVFELPFPDVVFGWYRFRIWDTVQAKQKAQSSLFQVEPADTTVNTAMLTYRNKTNRNGCAYELLPNFYHRVRYPLIYGGFQIAQERRQYRNVSNRRLRNLKSYKDYEYKIISYKFNEYHHKVIAEIYEHDTVYLNNSFIVPKTNYTIDEDIRTIQNNGEVWVITDESILYPIEGGVVFGRIFSDEFSLEFA
jgi:hypothetical protein